MRQMPGPGGSHFTCRRQLLVCELPHCLQELVARTAVQRRKHRDQRLVHQPGQDVESRGGSYCTGGVSIEPAGEHGEAAECGLLHGIEKVIAPLDRGADAATPGRL